MLSENASLVIWNLGLFVVLSVAMFVSGSLWPLLGLFLIPCMNRTKGVCPVCGEPFVCKKCGHRGE